MPNENLKNLLKLLKEEIDLLEKDSRTAYNNATEIAEEDVSMAACNKEIRIIRAVKSWRDITQSLDDAMDVLGVFDNHLKGIDDDRAEAAAKDLENGTAIRKAGVFGAATHSGTGNHSFS